MFSRSSRNLLIQFCFLAIICFAGKSGAERRIVGGQLTTIDKVPYLMQIRYTSGQFLCGGTLVDSKHVVTAAHCFNGMDDNSDTSELVVVGGATYRNETGIQRKVSKLFKHPKHNEGITHTNDIAVLKLDAAMEGPNVQTLSICSRRVPVGGYLQTSGWGQTAEEYLSNQVRTGWYPVFSHEECVERYSYREMSETMICASVLAKSSACYGDSGGPGVYGGELCGVVSFGRGCANHKWPGIFTDVTAVKDFVDRALES